MENLNSILITGGGAPGAPGIIKAIQDEAPKLKIYSCDVLEHTAGKILTNDYFTVPRGDDPKYAATLLKICIEKNIELILPITTKELIPLSEAKALFAQNGITVLVSEQKHLTISNNKGMLYQHLLENKIPVPAFRIAKHYTEFCEVEKSLNLSPYIIKPCVGNGSRGFRIIDNEADEHDLLFNHKPSSTYLSSKNLHSTLASKPFPELLLSEYLPGTEYTVDCLILDGNIKFILPRRRDKMNNGISVAGVIEYNKEIIEYCEAILQCLHLDGPIGIQVKYSKNNSPLIVEINPRIQGTTVACKGAGVNIPYLTFMKSELDNMSNYNDYPIIWGTKFIRHYSELYY
jgi:carbamoyl-phosphate synthase large subunit